MAEHSGQVKTSADVRRLGTILSVWAHPDDESFLAAGIMAAAVQNGQTVACVTATKGEAGSQDETKWPTATLADVRAREMAAALKILGIKQHHWLGYRDGECDQILATEAAAKIRSFIQKYHADSILTFGPEGWTGHGDHAAVSRWVSEAVKDFQPQPAVYHYIGTPGWYELIKPADEKLNIFFNIDHPPIVEIAECGIYFSLPAEIRELKFRALAASPSQTEVLFKHFSRKFLEEAFSVETYVRR